MAHNFQRPDLPYEAESLQNDKRYQLLTRSNKRPPTDVMLDTDFNYLVDAVRQLDTDIANIEAGVIPGADNPENAGSFLTTDGHSNLGWIKVQDDNIIDESISASKLIPGTITENEIMDGTITGEKIGEEEIEADNIASNAITVNKIADFAVNAAKIAPGAITTPKIAPGAITATEIASNAVTNTKIAAGSVSNSKIAAEAVSESKIASKAVTTDKIADKAVTATQIADNTITFNQISNSFAATKAQQQAASSSSVFVSPARQQDHPSAAKAYVLFNGTNGNIISQYGVSAVSRTADGTYLITFSTAFANALYITSITTENFSAVRSGQVDPTFTRTTTQVRIITISTAQTVNDSSFVNCIFYGTQ